jgi:hypothetical protein
MLVRDGASIWPRGIKPGCHRSFETNIIESSDFGRLGSDDLGVPLDDPQLSAEDIVELWRSEKELFSCLIAYTGSGLELIEGNLFPVKQYPPKIYEGTEDLPCDLETQYSMENSLEFEISPNEDPVVWDQVEIFFPDSYPMFSRYPFPFIPKEVSFGPPSQTWRQFAFAIVLDMLYRTINIFSRRKFLFFNELNFRYIKIRKMETLQKLKARLVQSNGNENPTPVQYVTMNNTIMYGHRVGFSLDSGMGELANAVNNLGPLGKTLEKLYVAEQQKLVYEKQTCTRCGYNRNDAGAHLRANCEVDIECMWCGSTIHSTGSCNLYRDKLRCYVCGALDHISYSCPAGKELVQHTPYCPECKALGHSLLNCHTIGKVSVPLKYLCPPAKGVPGTRKGPKKLGKHRRKGGKKGVK